MTTPIIIREVTKTDKGFKAAAECYYKEALQITIDFNDRFSQASTLHQLGRVAQEGRQWAAATWYGLEAAEIYIQH